MLSLNRSEKIVGKRQPIIGSEAFLRLMGGHSEKVVKFVELDVSAIRAMTMARRATCLSGWRSHGPRFGSQRGARTRDEDGGHVSFEMRFKSPQEVCLMDRPKRLD